MKNVFRLLVTFAASLGLTVSGAYASGGSSPTVSAVANATVVAPISVLAGTVLNFGTFASSASTQGTIDTSGNVTGGVEKISSGTPGTFTVSGTPSTNYTITGDSSVMLSDGNSGDNMTAQLTYPSGAQALNTSGKSSFSVSGVLAVAANQPANAYTGNYNVTVSY